MDWDPSKWIIAFLHRYTNLVRSVRVAEEEDISVAKEYMEGIAPTKSLSVVKTVQAQNDEAPTRTGNSTLELWSAQRILSYVEAPKSAKKRAVILLDGWVVDLTDYLPDHVSERPSDADFCVRSSVIFHTLVLTSRSPRDDNSIYSNSGSDSGGKPGGFSVLRPYLIRRANAPGPENSDNDNKSPLLWPDATWAFNGGMNNHSGWRFEGLERCELAE